MGILLSGASEMCLIILPLLHFSVRLSLTEEDEVQQDSSNRLWKLEG